jgi:transcriptional regulator with XRE-family HTH domain
MFPIRNMSPKARTMAKHPTAHQLEGQHAARFGDLIRARRKALHMNQDDVALATGVGRRFIIDLESGKASCQVGKALLVADAVGLRLFDMLADASSGAALQPDMPDDDDGLLP